MLEFRHVLLASDELAQAFFVSQQHGISVSYRRRTRWTSGEPIRWVDQFDCETRPVSRTLRTLDGRLKYVHT